MAWLISSRVLRRETAQDSLPAGRDPLKGIKIRMSVLQGTEFYISKRVGKAIMDYQMLSDGDKIAVAVSGGKDYLL